VPKRNDVKLTEKDIVQIVEDFTRAGEAAAEARRELNEAELRYRHWRAITSEDVSARNRKHAEWRIKAAIESMPGFASHKRTIAEAQETFDMCVSARDALLVQAMLMTAAHGHNPAHWPIDAKA
jgi:hypothetical protein